VLHDSPTPARGPLRPLGLRRGAYAEVEPSACASPRRRWLQG